MIVKKHPDKNWKTELGLSTQIWLHCSNTLLVVWLNNSGSVTGPGNHQPLSAKTAITQIHGRGMPWGIPNLCPARHTYTSIRFMVEGGPGESPISCGP